MRKSAPYLLSTCMLYISCDLGIEEKTQLFRHVETSVCMMIDLSSKADVLYSKLKYRKN